MKNINIEQVIFDYQQPHDVVFSIDNKDGTEIDCLNNFSTITTELNSGKVTKIDGNKDLFTPEFVKKIRQERKKAEEENLKMLEARIRFSEENFAGMVKKERTRRK